MPDLVSIAWTSNIPCGQTSQCVSTITKIPYQGASVLGTITTTYTYTGWCSSNMTFTSCPDIRTIIGYANVPCDKTSFCTTTTVISDPYLLQVNTSTKYYEYVGIPCSLTAYTASCPVAYIPLPNLMCSDKLLHNFVRGELAPEQNALLMLAEAIMAPCLRPTCVPLLF